MFNPKKITGLKAKEIGAGLSYSLVLATDNQVWIMGRFSSDPLPTVRSRQTSLSPIASLRGKNIAVGDYHSLIVGRT